LRCLPITDLKGKKIGVTSMASAGVIVACRRIPSLRLREAADHRRLASGKLLPKKGVNRWNCAPAPTTKQTF